MDSGTLNKAGFLMKLSAFLGALPGLVSFD